MWKRKSDDDDENKRNQNRNNSIDEPQEEVTAALALMKILRQQDHERGDQWCVASSSLVLQHIRGMKIERASNVMLFAGRIPPFNEICLKIRKRW